MNEQKIEDAGKNCFTLKHIADELLDVKWLDPACHKGCSSLFLKDEIKKLRNLIGEITDRIYSGYDWNDDPDLMRCRIDNVLLDEIL
jgi:hypothetical protein